MLVYEDDALLSTPSTTTTATTTTTTTTCVKGLQAILSTSWHRTIKRKLGTPYILAYQSHYFLEFNCVFQDFVARYRRLGDTRRSLTSVITSRPSCSSDARVNQWLLSTYYFLHLSSGPELFQKRSRI